jgi:hypothetical protein
MTSGSSDPAASEDSLKAVPREPIRISQRPTSDYGAVRGSLPSEKTRSIHNGRGHRAGKLLQRPGKISEMIVALRLFGPRTRVVVAIACIVGGQAISARIDGSSSTTQNRNGKS